MRGLFAAAAVFASGLLLGMYVRSGAPTALARGEGGALEGCSSENGDVNADGAIDLSDAVTILGNLFLGEPRQLAPLCPPLELKARIQELEVQLSGAQTELVACRAELKASADTTAVMTAQVNQLETLLTDCRAGSCPSYGLPDTGQTKCYDRTGLEFPCAGSTLYGQDGLYKTGCQPEGRYIDLGDGTVTDNCTGLMWQKNTADTSGDGKITPQDGLAWADALAFCEKLSFAGHDDWRLPNVQELLSIADYGRVFPSIDPVFGALSSFYWTSTSGMGSPGCAWFVVFDGGHVYGANKVERDYVRAVRNTR